MALTHVSLVLQAMLVIVLQPACVLVVNVITQPSKYALQTAHVLEANNLLIQSYRADNVSVIVIPEAVK